MKKHFILLSLFLITYIKAEVFFQSDFYEDSSNTTVISYQKEKLVLSGIYTKWEIVDSIHSKLQAVEDKLTILEHHGNIKEKK